MNGIAEIAKCQRKRYDRCFSAGIFRRWFPSRSNESVNEGLVLEILISDRHPAPFVLTLIEGAGTCSAATLLVGWVEGFPPE